MSTVVFENLTPLSLDVKRVTKEGNTQIAHLKPFSKTNAIRYFPTPGDMLVAIEKDAIITDELFIPQTSSVQKMSIGGVKYTDEFCGDGYQNLAAEISGLWFTNHFNRKIDIYHNGNLVAQVGTSKVYFCNSGYGIRFSDKFAVAFIGKKPHLEFSVCDRFTRSVHIGVFAIDSE